MGPCAFGRVQSSLNRGNIRAFCPALCAEIWFGCRKSRFRRPQAGKRIKGRSINQGRLKTNMADELLRNEIRCVRFSFAETHYVRFSFAETHYVRFSFAETHYVRFSFAETHYVRFQTAFLSAAGKRRRKPLLHPQGWCRRVEGRQYRHSISRTISRIRCQ